MFIIAVEGALIGVDFRVFTNFEFAFNGQISTVQSHNGFLSKLRNKSIHSTSGHGEEISRKYVLERKLASRGC
jgi:hypothetical protein